MVRFKYRIPTALESMVRQTIVDFNDIYFYGMMEEGVVHNLAHYCLYLICQTQFIGGMTIYRNPVVVVARNEADAIRIFYQDTGIDGASVHSILETRCDNLKVEAAD